ncbi:HAD-IA family hydrolase [Tardiphaga sp. vice278]|uniref:HAD-IA family hydrolase n=1 Tax=Tardiphaga sp. vice278 TaxID=2592815 RepID=UPI001164B283|nr:HAD-IA family hydrolase [Tardiphaga sp. vice278]QDM17635.1 HAD-IA family hydrolase [Tardiphaga sp. vice278]
MTSLLAPHSADALLFDIGRVVIDFDVDLTLAAWAAHGDCPLAELATRFVSDETFWRYETGKLSDTEFFALVRTSLGIEISEARLLEGWNATFIGEMAGIAPLLSRAAQHLPLYAFSNTNRAHVEHFSQHYAEVLRPFREIFLSSTIGLRKPQAEAYRHVVEAIGVPAGRIVFFDDLSENVEAARAVGLQAVHVRSSADVATALDALGL